MTDVPGIVKTPDTCFGRARVDGTRLAVWLLVGYRRRGVTDELLRSEFYPQLTPGQLAACWDYYRRHTNEIDREIWYQRDAFDIPEGVPPPAGVILAGLRLGIPEAEVLAAFEPPLTPADLDAAWASYWANPTAVDRTITELVHAG